MDERVRARLRMGYNDPASLAAYRHELERLLLGGYYDCLPQYLGTGAVWLEDLTNQVQRLDAEGLPVERDVPVFGVHGVPHKGGRISVIVRDLLDGEDSPYREQLDWRERTQTRPDGSLGDYGRWQLPCAHALTDVLDLLLAYRRPDLAQQEDVRLRALALFKRRLTDDSYLTMRQRVRYESRAPRSQPQVLDGVFDMYAGEIGMSRVEMVGPFREIQEGQDDHALLALTGKNAVGTKRIYSAVTGRPSWFYRLLRRPQQRVERALMLGRGVPSSRFGIGADGVGIRGIFVGGGRALGWSQSAQNFSP